MIVDWNLITWGLGLLISWSGFLVGIIRWFLQRLVRDLDRRLEGIRDAQQCETNEWRRVERELMELRAELPVNYVRREDHIRSQSVIEAKLDALASKIELARLEGAKNDR
ncbi:MAG: hypothetical protein HQL47_10295 [Gammaproteobacteria bacterium]|nr:hypothetical protein [Gammaproteobacteria bacterium]